MATETKSPEIVLDIEGMTCASCVHKVERALSGVDQVETAIVNLANRTAIVRAQAPEPGAGASVTIDGHVVAVGRPDRLPDELDEQVDRLSAQGLTTFVVRGATETLSGSWPSPTA